MPVQKWKEQPEIVNRLGADYARADVQALADGVMAWPVHRVQAGPSFTEAILCHRVISLAAELAILEHRVKNGASFEKVLCHRVSDSVDIAILQHRVQSYVDAEAVLEHRVQSLGQVMTEPPANFPDQCLPAYIEGKSEWEAAWQFGLSGLEMEIKAGIDAAVSLGDVPYKFEVTHERSAASTWTVSIVDDTGVYHPYKAGGAYENVLGKTKDHRISAKMTVGGRVFQYTGPATGFSHRRAAADAGWFKDMVWKGIDESRPLFERSVTLPTVRSTRHRVQRALPVAQEMVSAAGLTGIVGFRDFPIRLFHRQKSRYGDFLMKLFEAKGSQWRMRGRAVQCYDPIDGHGPVYHYTAEGVVPEEGYDSELADVITRVLVKRLNESDNEAGTDPEVATKFGKYRKDFDQPLYHVQWQILSQQLGAFSDFIFRDKTGNVIAVRDVRGGIWAQHLYNAPIINAVSVEYTFGAQPGVVGVLEGYGEIIFTGTAADKPDEEDFPDGFDSNFTEPVIDEELEDLFGEILEELDTNELIATVAEARSYGRGWLNKLKAALFPLVVTVPLNPDLVDGSRVWVTDSVLGVTIKRVVISVTHTFHDDPLQRQSVFTIGGYL